MDWRAHPGKTGIEVEPVIVLQPAFAFAPVGLAHYDAPNSIECTF
jgi:hypothetical protein